MPIPSSVTVNAMALPMRCAAMRVADFDGLYLDLPCISGERFLFLLPPHTSVRTLRG
jgi:hypothetical protein